MATKQKSGLYRAQVKVGVKADGSDVIKYISARTVRELEAKKEQLRAYYITGAEYMEDRLFGDFAIEWYNIHKKPEIKERQQGAYRSMLNKHVLPFLGDRNLRAISATDLQALVNRFAGSSKSQITMVLSVLKGVFGHAKRIGILTRSPAEDLMRPIATPPEERRALTEDERAVIVRTAHEHPEGAYLALLYYTGMRPGEARGLQWGDIDFARNVIHVQRDMDDRTNALGDLKTPAANRYIPLVSDLREYLLPLRGLPTAPVAPDTRGKHLGHASALRRWIRLMQYAGYVEPIEPGTTRYPKEDIRGRLRPTIQPYIMRHNYITMCWERGIDVQLVAKIVGHADVAVTMRTYTHLNNTHIIYAQDQFEEMFSSHNPAQTLHKVPAEGGRRKN